MIAEYLDFHELQGLDERFQYQMVVFVANVKEEVVLFQSADKMIEIEFPERLREGLENAKCELALINGVKVKDGVIQLSAHTTMIRVLDREPQNKIQSGFPISKSKSFPVGDYLNWPRDYDEEGKKALQKVFPVVGQFFERCTKLYMKPEREFKCNNALDNFLQMDYISKRWKKWSETTKEILEPSKQEEGPSMITFEVSQEDQNIKREYDSDEEVISRKRKNDSSSSESEPNRKINLLSSSDESPRSDESPTDSDRDFLSQQPIAEIGIRPMIEFSKNQRAEFQRSLAHFRNCCNGMWKPFIFKFLSRPDFVKIVCQTLTIVPQGQIKALETFLENGKVINRDEIMALLTRMKNTPPNFEF